ncbi:MAG: glycosyltransferase family 4 protein [Actinomycetota bacterium]
MNVQVALIDPLGQYGGNHYYTDQLARGLSRSGAEVTVYAHDGDVDLSPDRPYEYLEPFHGIYGDEPAAFRAARFLTCLAATFAGIKRRGTKIVHVQMWTHDAREILQICLARAMGKKVVVSAHEVNGWSSRRSSVVKTREGADDAVGGTGTRRFKWVLAHADAVVVHNRHSLDVLRARYQFDIPIEVIPLPHVSHTSATLPDRTSARKQLNLPEDKTIFLFFGNCRHEKGLEIALHALSEFREHDDVLLVIAGKMKPREEAYFREIADTLGLGRSLRMDIGLISDDSAIEYFRAANAVIVPYRQVSESGVAITASTLGRAMLASDLPPLCEATEDGRLGLLFRNGDAHELASAMRRALSMKDELDVMGTEARAKVLRERDPDAIGSKMVRLYRRTLRVGDG